MTALIVSCIAVVVVALLGWHAAYRTGVRHGRMLQSLDDRFVLDDAICRLARAEQLAERLAACAAKWERRARWS